MLKEWNTNGLYANRTPDTGLYNLGYFSGEKANLGIQYPVDGSYLNPESGYQNKFKDILAWIGNFLPQGMLLDVGCGPGHLSYWSQKLQLPFTIINSDISHSVLKFAREENDHASAVRNAANLLPFKQKSFDGVIFSDMLLLLWPKDAFQAVNQVSNLIKDKGFIFIKIGNRHSLTSSVKKESDHVWLPTIYEMRELLKSTGFRQKTISWFTRGFPFSQEFRQITGKDLCLPVGGSSILISAQK